MDITKSFKHFIFRQYRQQETQKHILNYLFWECTLRCNLSCLHCGSDCIKKQSATDMPIKDFVKVLDNIKQHNPLKNIMICITGGEPLMRSDLEIAGAEIVKRGFKWGIVTNALTLTQQRFQSLLKAGISSISISLDGFEEQHNRLRQNNLSYKNAISVIDMLVNLNKKQNFTYDIITCANKFNLNTLEKFRDMLIYKGVNRWRIFSIFPEGRAEKNNNLLALNKQEYKQLIEFIAQTRKQHSKNIRLNYSCEGYLGKYELEARDYFYFCRAGINVASVMNNGDVTGCLSVRAQDFIQGNIYKEQFMDIWYNKYQILRQREWAKKGICDNCKQWKKCLGNGLHLHSSLTDEVSRCNYKELNT